MTSRLRPAIFITSPVFRQPAWGSNHPLAIPRQTAMLDLCDMLGWMPADELRPTKAASVQTLLRFHHADYLSAFRNACIDGKVSRDVRERYHIGTMENPIFPGLFERAATTVGGAVLAAECALKGGVAYHPSGGTHHGRPDKASGFCYFNDPVFSILTLLEGGIDKVLYVDLDAHHGDGVQDAFANDARVMTVSIHEENRWPYSGALDDRGEDGYARNTPVPKGFNDSELAYLMDEAVLPLAAKFMPEAVVITCGADALAGDPLSGMSLSNGVLWQAVEALVGLSKVSVVLGGGGYNPWTVARCWAGLWGVLSGRKLPAVLPDKAQAMLRGLESDLVDEDEVEADWISTLRDQPNTGAVREHIKANVKTLLA
ncbi:MAG: acetoin utilization protein AcuC [Robiginitomaculum sp.]|nr:acetoin utilization protein AcuC [Robiginitomaculum sp.]MDQ7078936.1 acetoin utilization protein AcuC [Robiginitomaculum sp.]